MMIVKTRPLSYPELGICKEIINQWAYFVVRIAWLVGLRRAGIRENNPQDYLFGTTAILLKSGVKRKGSRSFGRGSGGGDTLADLNLGHV